MPISRAQRLDEVEDLPAIPHTLHKVLEAIDRVSSSAETLEKIVREDPVLTAKMLRMANSPYYGVSGQINGIAKAVVVLGFEEVRNMVIGLSLTGVFSEDLGFEEFDSKGLWLHSMGVAIASRTMAEHVPGLDPDELFTAGLVHDLGRFLLCLHFPEDLKKILDLRRTNQLTLCAAEEQYGLTHAEVGAYLAQKWGLSDMLTSILRYHHRPQGAGPHSTGASLVFLADTLCQKVEIGWSLPGEVDKVLVPKCLNLGPEVIKKVAVGLKRDKEDIEARWGHVLAD